MTSLGELSYSWQVFDVQVGLLLLQGHEIAFANLAHDEVNAVAQIDGNFGAYHLLQAGAGVNERAILVDR